MSFDASIARLEAQLGDWRTALGRDQAEAFGDAAAFIALLRELSTAGAGRAAAIKAGLASAWREFSSTTGSNRR